MIPQIQIPDFAGGIMRGQQMQQQGEMSRLQMLAQQTAMQDAAALRAALGEVGPQLSGQGPERQSALVRLLNAGPQGASLALPLMQRDEDRAIRDRERAEDLKFRHRELAIRAGNAGRPTLPAGWRMGANGTAERIPGLPDETIDNLTPGRAWATITRLSEGYSAGTLTPQQAREFEAAVAIASTPRSSPDPVTGMPVTTTPTLPDFVTRAIEARRARPATPPASVQPETDAGNLPDAEFARAFGAYASTLPPDPRRQQPAAPARPTLYDLAPQVTGMVPGALAAAQGVTSQIPVIGFNSAPPGLIENRQFFVNAQNEMIRALANNPRFPVAEMERIRREIDLSPGMLTDPRSLQERLRSIDTFLSGRLANEERAAQDTRLPVETRRAAAQAGNDIRNFIELMGVPRERAPQAAPTRGNAPAAPPVPRGVNLQPAEWSRLWGAMTAEERALWQN